MENKYLSIFQSLGVNQVPTLDKAVQWSLFTPPINLEWLGRIIPIS